MRLHFFSISNAGSCQKKSEKMKKNPEYIDNVIWYKNGNVKANAKC